MKTFRKLGEFHYPGEGWALTNDGTHLLMSDGTDQIRVLDPATMKEVRRITVTAGGKPLSMINELEWYKGEILAIMYGFFGVGGNNHQSFFELGGKFYIAYHAQTLNKAVVGGDGSKVKGYRSTHVNEVSFNADGTIKPVTADYAGAAQIGALDAFTREELWYILRDLWTEQQFNVILVTHDLRESVFLADTVYVMSRSPGRFVVRREIELPRPRELEVTYTKEFTDIVLELRGHIGAIRSAASEPGASPLPQ